MSVIEQTPLPDANERRQEIMMDAAGFNGYVAMAATIGFDQNEVTDRILKHSERRPDHRGGRSYPEGEQDPYWDVPYKPLTPEELAQQEAVKQSLGYRQAHQIAAMAEDREIARRAKGDVTLQLALQRARTERRNRRNSL